MSNWGEYETLKNCTQVHGKWGLFYTTGEFSGRFVSPAPWGKIPIGMLPCSIGFEIRADNHQLPDSRRIRKFYNTKKLII